MKFRKLRADEIDCRVSTVSEKGCSLLLYKDARCDMNILDETVGSMNWQRKHTRENANCIVAIWDANKGAWIEKEDVGTESNTEKEKGLASDSFKRACVNWGIGRELYTAPFIWIPAELAGVTPDNRTRSGYTCKERFEVSEIDYDDKGNISKLTVVNRKTKAEVFKYPVVYRAKKQEKRKEAKRISEKDVEILKNLLAPNQIEFFLNHFKKADLSELTELECGFIHQKMKEKKEKDGNEGKAD